MAEYNIIDNQEKVNILFKEYLGFTSTNKVSPYYNENNIPYNNNIHQEYVFLDNIPSIPQFDISGIRTAEEIGLISGDFHNYDASDINICSIADDTTGTIRRFKNLKLIDISNTNSSSFTKFDISGDVVLKDSIQFNKNQYFDNSGTLIKPYFYSLKNTTNPNGNYDSDINPSANGINWMFDVKSGIVFFVDITSFYNINNFILTFYKYIGKKGIVNLDIPEDIDISASNIVGISNNSLTLGVYTNTLQDLSGAGIDVCNNVAQLYFNTSISGDKPERWVSNIALDISDNLFIRRDNLAYTSFVDVVEKIVQTDTSVNSINNKVIQIDTSVNSINNKVIQIDTSVNSINNKINAIENIKYKIFDVSNITVNNANIQDLSNIFDLSIIPIQDIPKINIIIKTNFLSSYALQERINIELWKYSFHDNSNILLTKDNNLGSINATGGLIGTYYNNFIDYDISNNKNYKYYLKYKLENNLSGFEQGLINLKTNSNEGSGIFILKEI